MLQLDYVGAIRKELKMQVIRSEKLSSAWEDRFVIIDETTQAVLDDAQGYGYKTAQSAHKAWAYKNNKKTKKRVDGRKKQEKKFRRWWEKHPEFEREVEEIYFRAFKDEHHGMKHTKEEIYEACATIAKEMGIEDFKKEML